MDRRAFLQSGGALAVFFAVPVTRAMGATPIPDPKNQDPAKVSAWLTLNREGTVTLHAGKVELGTGVQTALAQLVAEELALPIQSVIVKMGDTLDAVDQGPTIGSLTLKTSMMPVRRAAATARAHLIARAAQKLGRDPAQVTAEAGAVHANDAPRRRITYARLVSGDWTALAVDEHAPLKAPGSFEVIGHPVPRLELPDKVRGAHRYMQNIRLPGMLHARVLHAPIQGATLVKADRATVATLPGFVDLVIRQNFVAVVCEREYQAVKAAQALAIEWKPAPGSIASTAIYDAMQAERGDTVELRKSGDAETTLASAARRLSNVYRTSYQTHGSIGPSCGVADVRADQATIWSATQGSFPLRDAIAALIAMPKDKVRVIWTEGAGCYGHNGSDDASAEAALLSKQLGRPVRVQWMRHDEHGWDPKGPATEIRVHASLTPEGGVDGWSYLVASPTHISRPMGAPGNLLPGRAMGLPPKSVRVGGDHCARSLYQFPNEHVAVRWLPDGPLRPSALRGLGAVANSFATESMMDELAALGGMDPIALRLAHLKDERARAVIERVRDRGGWSTLRATAGAKPDGTLSRGAGMAFAELEPGGAYVAAVCQVEVDAATGAIHVRRVFVAHDCGMIINPDGLRNQIQGCVIQTLSRCLKEEFRFSDQKMLSVNWGTYPILRFDELPDDVTIDLLDPPDQPPVGAGEPTALVIAPAVANAVFDATRVRLRRLPFSPENFLGAAKPTAPTQTSARVAPLNP